MIGNQWINDRESMDNKGLMFSSIKFIMVNKGLQWLMIGNHQQ